MMMLEHKTRLKQGMSVLIVEDDRLFREMLCEIMQILQPTWHIYEAKNGQEGLELAQTQCPDLILLDFHMPVMNGYQLALALQQTVETCSIPLILSTSEDSAYPQIRRLRTLCQAVLLKPFSIRELERVLGEIKFARPVVGAGAGLHADHAGRQRRDQLVQLVARHGGPNQLGLADLIDAMHRENILGEVNTYGQNRHGLPLPNKLMRVRTSHRGTSMPYSTFAWAPRDGEVPSIR